MRAAASGRDAALFTSEGALWRRQRKILAPLFTPRAPPAYAVDMVACAQRALERWSDGEALSLTRETTRLTLGIAGKALFDADGIGQALTVALPAGTSVAMERD